MTVDTDRKPEGELLYFSADWCRPCLHMAPIIEKFALDHPVRKIDVESDKELSDLYEIQVIPSYIILSPDGWHIVEWNGACTYEDLVEQWSMCEF